MAKSKAYQAAYYKKHKAIKSGKQKRYTTADQTVEEMRAKTLRTDDIDNANYKSVTHTVLNVAADGNGGITVTKAKQRDTGEGSRKYPIYEYDVKGAYIVPGVDSNSYSDDRDATVVNGVNFKNVKAIKGDTFEIRTFLKQNGYKWDSQKKAWVK